MINIKGKYFFWITSAAFIILYCIPSYYNRLSHDDLQYMHAVIKDGVVNASLQNFHHWNTRWAAIFFINTVFSFYNYHGNFILYHLITLGFLTGSVFFLIKIISENYFEKTISSTTAFLYSILFVASFFFATFSREDAWFWLNASSMYLWNISFACFGVSLILSRKNNFLFYLIIINCGLYIGGASEPLAVVIILFLFTALLLSHKIKFITGKNKITKLIVLLLFCIIGFAISYSGTGNEVRRAAIPTHHLNEIPFIFFKAMIKLWIFHLPLKIFLTLVFCAPWMYLGFLFKPQDSLPTFSRRIIFKTLALFFIVTCLSTFPVVYILGESGPERTWTQISFYLVILISSLFFYAGYCSVFKEKIMYIVVFTCLMIFFTNMSISCYQQYFIISKYAKAVDERNIFLIELKEKKFTGVIEVDSLPPSGYLHSNEISIDKNYFTNQMVKSTLELPFDIELKK